MQIAMLGPLEVRTDSGAALEVAGARLRRLLIALALQPRQVVATHRLVDAVWGDEPPAETANAMQALVSRLRRTAPGIEITSRGTGYRLDIDDESIDIRRFERLAAQGRVQLRAARATTPADPAAFEAAARTLRAALALWRGAALADVTDTDSTRGPVARLEELRLVAISDRIDADLSRGPDSGLVAELEGLVAVHPLREPLVALLMRALADSGDRGRALAAYQDARTRLVETLGVAPSAELAAEHLRILRLADDVDAPAGASESSYDGGPSARASNLRAELTSFVGRERDLAGVARLIGTSRLTTLVGPGGAGKTRLAAQAARARLADTPDGVWLVEFASVSDQADLAQAVLGALGVRERTLSRAAGAPLDRPVDRTVRLVDALAAKRTLLVFDNCEHVIGAAATLAHTILGQCPEVRILATSREPLGVTGEALWPVESLALPPDDAGSPESVGGYASVRLLTHRATAVRPGFAVTTRNASEIGRICRALDGMPLAIELAAARLRTMPPEQLAARLDDRFQLLTGGSRTALPRHQTLRAMVDWSWDLLDNTERAVWRRLSVFAGGATLEAALAVCGDEPDAPADGDDGQAVGGIDAHRMLDLLTALADKSLLVVRDDGDEPRYLMLETIRAYGATKLDEAGETRHTRRSFAHYFRALAERASTGLFDSDQLTWLDRLTADHDNMQAATRVAINSGDAEVAVRLCGALGWYWWLRGYRREGVELICAALAMEPDELMVDGMATYPRDRDEQRAAASTIGALLALDGTRDLDLAMRMFEAAAHTVVRVGYPQIPLLRLVLPLHKILELFLSGTGPDTLTLDLPVDDPEPWLAATARVMRAHVLLNYGRDHLDAERDFLSALTIYQSRGERWGTAFAQSSLATLLAWRGECDKAADLLDEALRCLTELGGWEDMVTFRVQLIRLMWLSGQTDRAREQLRIVQRDSNRLTVPEAQSQAAHVAGDLARLDGDLVTARRHLDQAAEFSAHSMVARQFRAFVESSLGLLDAACGDIESAREHHQQALRLAISSVDAPVIGYVLVGLADLAVHDGDPGHAALVMGISEAVRGVPDLSHADGLRVTATARAALGESGYAQAHRLGVSVTRAMINGLVDSPLPFRQMSDS